MAYVAIRRSCVDHAANVDRADCSTEGLTVRRSGRPHLDRSEKSPTPDRKSLPDHSITALSVSKGSIVFKVVSCFCMFLLAKWLLLDDDQPSGVENDAPVIDVGDYAREDPAGAKVRGSRRRRTPGLSRPAASKTGQSDLYVPRQGSRHPR